MKTTIGVAVFLILVLITYPNIGVGQEQSTSERPEERIYTYQERELEYIMNIWPGEYDNIEQLDFDKALTKQGPEKGGHSRVHNHTEHIHLQSFGDHVLYVEEYKNDDPSKLSRRCIYSLKADEEEKAIRIKVYHFRDTKPYLAAKKELDFLASLKPDSPLLKQGCDILLQREGMAFRGITAEKNCIEDPADPNLTLDYQIRITESEYWFEEVKYEKASISRLADELQVTPYQLEKARCFVCMVDFPKEKGGRPTETKYYIKIHDQGGKFEFDYDDGRHMVLGMRNTWSFGMQRETFVIFIQEGSQKGPTLIYSWGEPGAGRIGFNPGWIRVQCDLDTPKNRKLQHGLRPGS